MSGADRLSSAVPLKQDCFQMGPVGEAAEGGFDLIIVSHFFSM
jgi:hypothetical protein